MMLPNLLLKCGMFRSPFWSYSFTQFFFFSNVLEKFVLLFFSGYGFADFFHWPRAQKFSSQILALWNAAIFVVCDIIWLQRNKWIFEGFSLTFSIVKATIYVSVREIRKLDIDSISDFVDDLTTTSHLGIAESFPKSELIKEVI